MRTKGIAMLHKQKKTIWFLVTMCFLLIALSLIRFNRNSGLVKRDLNDAASYIAYTEYFRGETPSVKLEPASNWRPLTPAIASLLPFSPMTSINIVNVISLLISLYVFYKLLVSLQFSDKKIKLGLFLYVFSFPIVYYATIGYVDPLALLFCVIGVYGIVRKNWALVAFTLFAGIFAKETTAILIPAAAFYFYKDSGLFKALFYLVGLLFIFVLTTIMIHKFAPYSEGANMPTFWWFSTEAISYNFGRINFYLSFVLSMGICGILLITYPIKKQIEWIKSNALQSMLLIGIITGLLLFVFASITAAADGRIIWMLYPFLIPYVLNFNQKHLLNIF